MKKIFLFLIFPTLLYAQGTGKTPNYPERKTTGDVQADEANWIKSKNEWIKNHPEEYRSLGGHPEVLRNQQNEAEHVPVKTEALPAFDAVKTYQLVELRAIPVAGYAVSDEDIAAETESIKKSFPLNKTEFQLGANQQIRLFQANTMDLRGVEKRTGSVIEWYFENKECETCSKTLFLDLKLETTSQLIYLQKGEDQDAKFSYQFTFSITNKK